MLILGAIAVPNANVWRFEADESIWKPDSPFEPPCRQLTSRGTVDSRKVVGYLGRSFQPTDGPPHNPRDGHSRSNPGVATEKVRHSNVFQQRAVERACLPCEFARRDDFASQPGTDQSYVKDAFNLRETNVSPIARQQYSRDFVYKGNAKPRRVFRTRLTVVRYRRTNLPHFAGNDEDESIPSFPPTLVDRVLHQLAKIRSRRF